MNEESSAPALTSDPTLSVLYDGACPLCRREITPCRGLRAEPALRFVDVSGESALPPSTTREQLLARF